MDAIIPIIDAINLIIDAIILYLSMQFTVIAISMSILVKAAPKIIFMTFGDRHILQKKN